jgi:hypothetical protein
LIDKGEFGKARAMRADPGAPPLERLKQVKSMKVVSVVAYPRISRTQGSVYVHLKIDKKGAKSAFKGRVDWEERNGKWVTTNWDSKAAAPGKE